MRPLHSVLIFVAAVFFGGALMAPWLYWLAQACAPWHPALADLADNPFHRFVNRSFIAIAILGLWPFLRSLKFRSARDIGFISLSGQWTKLAGGLALGFGSLAIAAALAVAAGARTTDFDFSSGKLIRHLANAGLAAIVVGIMEETVFRGALFGALRKAHSWTFALTVSSAIYALVHFFEKPPPPETVHWATGLVVLGEMLRGFVQVDRLLPAFLSLFLVGSLLALAYQRTGNLYFSIGLHAGWIFWLKSFGFLTRPGPAASSWFWGSGKLLDGWLAFVLLGLTLVVFARLPLTRPKAPPT